MSSGKKLFERGNSTARLLPAVVKVGDGERERGEYIEFLGSEVCPEIYGIFEHGYVMPFLEEVQPDTTSLCRIEELLRLNVWCRPPKGITGANWPEHLATKICTPDYPGDPQDDILSLTHGDCTVSNLMRGPGGYVLVDALPPRDHVAQSPFADMGRILQSAAGWETFRYGQEIVDYEAPAFWKVNMIRRRALWWCGATALRIAIFNDPAPEIVSWCNKVAEVSFDASRV